MGKERKRIRDAFLSLYNLMSGDIPPDYIRMFYHSYDEEGESWLDLFPLVTGYGDDEIDDVADFLSYINPKFFPPRESIISIDFSKLVGGKGRKCTKGVKTKK